jgi:hypothetical protein
MNQSPQPIRTSGDQRAGTTLQGKTYSLRPHEESSDAFYEKLTLVANRVLVGYPGLADALADLHRLRKKRRFLRQAGQSDVEAVTGDLVPMLENELGGYVAGVAAHIEQLRFIDRWDRTLTTTAEQYYLMMLEIELTNRLFADRFRASQQKFAFLPHCLRDLEAACRATQRGIDYVCKGCTDTCMVNNASKMLRRHRVKPYIWMKADLRSLFRNMKKEEGTPGVLGIACIPELVRGMRMCMKYDVPVVGVPLDANRCARWWGKFHWNSVNLNKLHSLLTGTKVPSDSRDVLQIFTPDRNLP